MPDWNFTQLTDAELAQRLVDVRAAITSARSQQAYATAGLSVTRGSLALLYDEEAALSREQQDRAMDASGADEFIEAEIEMLDDCSGAQECYPWR